jgi:GH24 family phage-related lysozyme (muramidase)
MASKTKLSAAVLGLVLAGASAPTILDQFLNEKEGNSLTAYRDGAGIWTICRGATLVDGKPVRQGMKLTQEKCDQVNAKERDAALAWVDKNIHVPLTEPQKAGIASFCPYNIRQVNAFPPRSTSASMLVTVKVRVRLFAGGLRTAAKIAGYVPTTAMGRLNAGIRKARLRAGG